MKTKCFLALFLVWIVADRVLSQNAGEIIGKYLDELGGLEKLRAWKGMKGTGKYIMVSQGGKEIPVTFWFMYPNKQRQELMLEHQIAVYATDGVTPWFCDPTRGVLKPMPMPAEQVKRMNENDDEYPFVDYEKKGHTVELLGEENLEGRRVFKVKLRRRSRSESMHYFDAETGRELKYCFIVKTKNGDVMQEAIERDFRRVDWLLMPFEIETRVDGQSIRKLIMDTIEVDPEMHDSLFTMPRSKLDR